MPPNIQHEYFCIQNLCMDLSFQEKKRFENPKLGCRDIKQNRVSFFWDSCTYIYIKEQNTEVSSAVMAKIGFSGFLISKSSPSSVTSSSTPTRLLNFFLASSESSSFRSYSSQAHIWVSSIVFFDPFTFFFVLSILEKCFKGGIGGEGIRKEKL